MKSLRKYYFILTSTIILIALALFTITYDPQLPVAFKTLIYVSLGLGCMIFGYSIQHIISIYILNKEQSLNTQLHVEIEDERNMFIANMAKSKAFDLMLFVFAALFISFLVMKVEPTILILLLFSYTLIIAYAFYCRRKYEKES